MSKIVQLYYERVKDGRMTIDEVPARWRDAVQELLDE